MRISLLWLGLGSMALAACSSESKIGDGTPGLIHHWCQVDDPGFVREQLKIGGLAEAAIDQVECGPETGPEDLPDEIVLPMACDRRMVFRAVRVAISDVLDSEDASFGNSALTDPYSLAQSGYWKGKIAGSFTAGEERSGVTTFYISKYEITEPQFAVFGGISGADEGNCDAVDAITAGITGTGVHPATGMSWVDAVAFADRYSRWLIAEEGGSTGSILPARGARPGYLRLPTEEEWEFAARGADETGARSREYLIPADWKGERGKGGVDAIAWHNEFTLPEGRKTFPVGRKAPNELMLFDMVGNAEEMVADFFRPVQPDGNRTGRSGGIVVKGGSALDGSERVGVGVRNERPIYSSEGSFGSQSIGFRLVLSAPFATNRLDDQGREMQGNPALEDAIADAWTARSGGVTNAGGARRSEAVDLIETIVATKGADAQSRDAALSRLSELIRQASSEVAAAEIRSTEELFLGALMTAGYASERSFKIAQTQEFFDGVSPDDLDVEGTKKLEENYRLLEQNKRERDATFEYYVVSVSALAEKSEAEIAGANQVIRNRIARAGMDEVEFFRTVLVDHVREAKEGGVSSQERRAWRKRITGTE